LLKVLEETQPDKPSLLEENTPIQLQYSFKRIPQLKNKRVHVRVPHSTITDNTDICLFVKDVHKDAEDREDSRDFQPSVRHFRKIVEDAGVFKVEEIIPVIQLKREFRDFETQKKLSDSYDLFLCDDRVSKFMPKLLGKSFIQKRKLPVNVKLHNQEVACKSLKKALNSIHGLISGQGGCSSLTIGHTGLSAQQNAENVDAAVKHLISFIPGGWSNIRNLYVTTTKSTSVPLYISTESPNEIQLPPDVKKERKMIAVGDPGLIGDEDDDGEVKVFDDGSIVFDGHEEFEEDIKPRLVGKKASHAVMNGDSAPTEKSPSNGSANKEGQSGNKKFKKKGILKNNLNESAEKKEEIEKTQAEGKSPARKAKEKNGPPPKKVKVASTKGPLSKKPRLA